MVKFVYFDIGEVIVDCRNYFKRTCKDFDLDFDNFVDFFVQHKMELITGKIKTEEFWKKCIEKYQLKDAGDYDLVKWWVSDYKTIKPISKLIYDLAHEVEIGIISNINSGLWEDMVKVGIVPNIEYKKILLSCNLGIKKPDKKIYEIAQNEAGVGPDEILFVDNQEKNLVVPRELGWNTLLFDRDLSEEMVEEITRILSVK
ncbi:HAD hydrolase-like protein [Candidatus Shapirobacteria bacterium]|nr:HAD hydrolase-like protein [Candidatus Shapirobacteria bacterium]